MHNLKISRKKFVLGAECEEFTIMKIVIIVLQTYFKANAEREGQSGDHHGPGDGGEDPAAHADTIVSVVSCNTATIISCS